MAIYHCSIKTHTRSKGESAVNCAAYRAAERLRDERLGKTFDYRRKQGVLHTEIVVPSGTPIPAREQLWQAQEAADGRRNARVAREVEVSLPAEQSHEERLALSRELAAALSRRYHVAVDLALHAPGRRSDHRNVHAHLLMTTREWSADGRLTARVRAFDGRGGSLEVRALRALWADLCNRALERGRHSDRVDHRSYADRGIDKTPQLKLGPARHIEAAGRQSRRAALARSAVPWTGTTRPTLLQEVARRTHDAAGDVAQTLVRLSRRERLNERGIERAADADVRRLLEAPQRARNAERTAADRPARARSR